MSRRWIIWMVASVLATWAVAWVMATRMDVAKLLAELLGGSPPVLVWPPEAMFLVAVLLTFSTVIATVFGLRAGWRQGTLIALLVAAPAGLCAMWLILVELPLRRFME